MNISRRSFIKNTSVVAAGIAVAPNNVISEGRKKEKLAIQLFSVEKEMHSDAAKTLRALRNIGYEHVEHAGYASGKFYGYAPAEFRNFIKDCGLTLLSGHAALEIKHWDNRQKDFTPEWKQTIHHAATAGQQYLITPWLDYSLWNNETELKRFMEVLNKSGELCKKEGLQFGYHNHRFEFEHFFGHESMYDIIMNYTDPKLVTQQLDIGNAYKKDFFAAALFHRYPQRFEMIHLKDMTSSYNRNHLYTSTTIGTGLIDIKHIMNEARRHGGTSCFIIEQDCFSNKAPLDCAKENFLAM